LSVCVYVEAMVNQAEEQVVQWQRRGPVSTGNKCKDELSADGGCESTP